MNDTTRLRQDLDYVASAVRRSNGNAGVPAIYFMWAVIIAIGFALPDIEPTLAGPFWVACGIGGGLASWWLAERDSRQRGALDHADGKRHGWHWLVCGLAFLVCWLPVLRGSPIDIAVGNFLLVAGLGYALAGVHLERPLLWSGLIMLVAYGVLNLVAMPYVWTLTGLLVALALVVGGVGAQRGRSAGQA